MNRQLQIAARAATPVLLSAGLIACDSSAKDTAAELYDPRTPHCLVEDGGPQPVCVWDSAVDGNRTPAAPNNTITLFTSQPGQDPVARRIK